MPAETTAVLPDAPHCPTCSCGREKPAQRRVGGIRRDARDARFSKAVRQRDRFTCQRCGTVHAENSSGLHAMHMFSRRIQATRFDMENAAAGCYGCHQYLDSHPNEKQAFFRQRLGDEAFDALSARAHAKRDRRSA